MTDLKPPPHSVRVASTVCLPRRCPGVLAFHLLESVQSEAPVSSPPPHSPPHPSRASPLRFPSPEFPPLIHLPLAAIPFPVLSCPFVCLSVCPLLPSGVVTSFSSVRPAARVGRKTKIPRASSCPPPQSPVPVPFFSHPLLNITPSFPSFSRSLRCESHKRLQLQRICRPRCARHTQPRILPCLALPCLALHPRTRRLPCAASRRPSDPRT
ncbi:hypothetical protein K456DRAFT_734736 [Colletotrichum gloeosporioides 23]|nr:hypothetical protein K456DRAFT_734736 [Colletotrichum gloeosporioides 23]